MKDGPLECVLERLTEVTGRSPVRSGADCKCCCPAHDDRNPSLSVSEADDGRVLLHCFAGCRTEDVLDALGMGEADLFLPNRQDAAPSMSMKPRNSLVSEGFHGRQVKTKRTETPKGPAFSTLDAAIRHLETGLGTRSACWTYRHADRSEAGAVVRWDPSNGKEIRPLVKTEAGWHVGAMAEPRPLFRLPDVMDCEVVYVVEGEKAADAARSIGLDVTTSSGGSNAAGQTEWSPLAGKQVVIFPDRDDAGWKYAETVAGIVTSLPIPAEVRLVDLADEWPELPEKGDLDDWCEAHRDIDPAELKRRIEALVDRTECWKPETVRSAVECFRPFPIEQLPETVRGFVESGATAIGCDASSIAVPLLAVLGSAIGNARHVRLKGGWDAPPIVWAAIVGKSGSMKTPAWSLAMSPVFAIEKDAEREFQSAYARHQEEVAARCRSEEGDASNRVMQITEPKPTRFTVSDTTIEALAPLLLDNPRGLLVSRDELSGWIGSFDRFSKGRASSDASHWLSMFNAKPLRVDRKTGEPRTLYVPSASVSVCGGIQPGTLRRAVGVEHRENGLLARFLLVWPPQRQKRWTEDGVDSTLLDEVTDIVRRLRSLDFETDRFGDATPGIVALSPDAADAFRDFYNQHAEEQAGLDDDLAAAWSKLEEYAARLALIVHLTRFAAGEDVAEREVDLVSMRAGIELTRWFCHEARRVYAMLDQSEAERSRAELAEWIRRKGGAVSVPDVQGGHRRFRSAAETELALEELVKAGFGQWLLSPTGKRGGRPTRRFKLLDD